MAVIELNHQVHRYIGASTDTKPTATSHGTTTGSTFYEQDTGIMYITYDGTNWVEKDTIVRLETSPSIDIGDVTLLAGTAVVGKTGHDITTFGSVTVVGVAGTPTALAASSTPAKYAKVQNNPANTGRAAVGDAAVDETAASVEGLILYSGESTPWIPCDNLTDIYVDVAVNGEKLLVIYVN